MSPLPSLPFPLPKLCHGRDHQKQQNAYSKKEQLGKGRTKSHQAPKQLIPKRAEYMSADADVAEMRKAQHSANQVLPGIIFTLSSWPKNEGLSRERR